MHKIISFIYSLFPNIKEGAVPTREELNNFKIGARWIFDCAICEYSNEHVKQEDNTWKCCDCGISEIDLSKESHVV